jgi:hypothetical protein
MAKINRVNGNVQAFASAAIGTERTIFGDVAQSNDLTAQFSADFLRGWGIVGPSDQPALEDFNGAMYTHGQMLAYLHQAGVPEYNAAQEYFVGSVTQAGGDIYISLAATNIGNAPASSPASWRLVDSPGTLVDPLNLRMNVAAASASATVTASSVVVGASLSGKKYLLTAFSKVINLATTGAGGMDTGAAPVSGYVAIYAIYNPTTGVSALLAQNASSSVAAPIYAGANMPAGYTASGLLTVAPTNGSSQFPILSVFNREVKLVLVTVLNITTNRANAPLSIATAVPQNAVEISGELEIISSSASNVSVSIAGTNGTGQQVVGSSVSAGGNIVGNYAGVPVVTAQTINAAATTSGAGPTFKIYIGGYKI